MVSRLKTPADVAAAAAGWSDERSASSGGLCPASSYFDWSAAANSHQPRSFRNSAAHYSAAGCSSSAELTAADQHSHTGGTHLLSTNSTCLMVVKVQIKTSAFFNAVHLLLRGETFVICLVLRICTVSRNFNLF